MTIKVWDDDYAESMFVSRIGKDKWHIRLSTGASTSLWDDSSCSAREAVLKAKTYFENLDDEIADALTVFEE